MQQEINYTRSVPVLIEPKDSPEVPTKYLSDQYYITSRPQYKRSCGMSSLVSIFNYQFSTYGLGKLPPITVQEAYLRLNVIGTGSRTEQFQQQKNSSSNTNSTDPENSNPNSCSVEKNNLNLHDYLDSLDFGYFTYNDTLLSWYRLLCRIYGVKGRASYFYKVLPDNSTTGVTEKMAKKELVQGLNSKKTSYIYHAYDHYFCPVGYEVMCEQEKIDFNKLEDAELWILVAETAQRNPPLHILKWEEIVFDLSTAFKYKIDVRKRESFAEQAASVKGDGSGSTFHCIMSFEKLD